MALPVGKPIESNNKELELVASLLEKTLKELEETKKGFEELKLKDQEKQENFKTFVNKVVETLNKKDFNPTIKLSTSDLLLFEREVSELLEKHSTRIINLQQPKKFWSFTGKELYLLGITLCSVIIMIFSLNYNFNTSRILKAQNESIFKNQKALFDIYRQESKFWYSKAHQKAYATSVVNGELDKAIKKDEKEYQEKLKAEKGKFNLNK